MKIDHVAEQTLRNFAVNTISIRMRIEGESLDHDQLKEIVENDLKVNVTNREAFKKRFPAPAKGATPKTAQATVTTAIAATSEFHESPARGSLGNSNRVEQALRLAGKAPREISYSDAPLPQKLSRAEQALRLAGKPPRGPVSKSSAPSSRVDRAFEFSPLSRKRSETAISSASNGVPKP